MTGISATSHRASAHRLKADALIVLALVAAALTIRLYGIGDRSLWLDEGASLTFARAAWGDLWGPINLHEPNPPGYYSLLKLWIALVPVSETALRLPSALASAFCLVPLYVFAERAWGRRTAILAATLLAVSGIHLQFGQEARSFSMISLIFLSGLVAGQRLADAYDRSNATRPLGRLALFAVCCGLLPHLHYTGFLATSVLFVYVGSLLILRRRLTLGAVVDLAGAGCLVLVVAGTPFYWTLIQLGAGADLVSWIPRPSLKDAIETYRGVLGHGFLENPDGFRIKENALLWLVGTQTLSDGLLAGLGAVALVDAVRREQHEVVALAFAVAFFAVLFFVVSQFRPLLMPRTILFGSGLVILIIAYGLTVLRPVWLAAAATATVLAVQLANLHSAMLREPLEPWREAIAAVGASGEETAVVFVGSGIMVPGLVEAYWHDDAGSPLFLVDPDLDRFPFVVERFPQFVRIEHDHVCGPLGGFDRIVLINRGHGTFAPAMNRETEEVNGWLAQSGARMQSGRVFDELIFQEWSGLAC